MPAIDLEHLEDAFHECSHCHRLTHPDSCYFAPVGNDHYCFCNFDCHIRALESNSLNSLTKEMPVEKLTFYTEDINYPYPYTLELWNGAKSIKRIFHEISDRDAAADMIEFALGVAPFTLPREYRA